MKKKAERKKKTAGRAAALVLFCALIFGGMPYRAAVADDVPDPKVTVTVSPDSIKEGNPFDATFHFSHEYDPTPAPRSAVIRVSSPNNAVRIGKSEFLVTKFDEDDEDDDSDSLNYNLYIPERYLTYVGPGSGTLRFTITYCSDGDGKDKIEDGKFTVQKTVVYASGDSGSLIRVDENSATPSIRSGSSAIVAIPLISSGPVSDARIKVTVPAENKISLSTAGSVYTMSFASGEKKDLNLPLAVDASVAEGIYPITLNIDGADMTAYVRVSSSGKGGLIVESYHLDRKTVYSGSRFRMDLVIKNTGARTLHNVTAALDSLATEAITVSGALDRQTAGSLAPGASASVSFPLSAASKMETGNYIVSVGLTADELEEAAVTKAFVPVSATASTDGSKPVIIIESYDFGSRAVTGGKEFGLTLNFKNTNPSTAIQNLKITISSTADEDTGGVFTPANSSNTFFVSKLGAGAGIQKKIDLYPKADAVPKSYGIDVKFEYESASDSKHEPLTATETISIPLTQPDRFEVTGADLFGPISVGTDGQLSISYVNKGKSTVYNLSVVLAGNFTAPEMNSYIGNVESGTSDSFEANLTPQGEGTLRGTATLTYEDPNGETKEIVKDFSCEVTAQQAPDEGMLNSGAEPVPGGAGGGTGKFVLIAALAAAGAAAFLVIRKKRAKKKQLLLDMEDDYDDLPPESAEGPEETAEPAAPREGLR